MEFPVLLQKPDGKKSLSESPRETSHPKYQNRECSQAFYEKFVNLSVSNIIANCE